MAARRGKRQARRRVARWSRPSPRLLKRVAGLSLIVLLVLGGTGLLALLNDAERLPVRRIEVVGELRHVAREQVLRRIDGLARGQSFFALDIDAVREAARSIPWVDEIRARRRWPDGLRIEVVEQQAVLRWNDQALVNARGEVFEAPRASFPRGLANLRGGRRDLKRLFNAYRDIQRRLNAIGLRVAELELNERGGWRMRLDGGPLVELGGENLGRRVARLIRLYPRLNADPGRRPARLDLRYANGLSVAWRKIEQGLAARGRSARGKS